MTLNDGGPEQAAPIYNRIGVGYAGVRRPDPRLAALIASHLAGAETVLNVGAGAGSYEPEGVEVTALDPSQVMLDQHPGTRKVLGRAEEMPFDDGRFDAAMGVLTVHHWSDVQRGLAEMRRVSRRQVLYTWDPGHDTELWIVSEYFPQVRELEQSRVPKLADVAAGLGAHTVVPFPIPHDFTDGSQCAFWRRPHAYLDPAVRAASSTFHFLTEEQIADGVARLSADLDSGAWHRRHADLLERDAVDYGFRLLIAGD
ncbi:class I SAM-dependent methyltransferase [Yinghuangia seranimata]|uniref:class I SAM-dependent methyltransferase n=1 Tax=Yinghuangia seranimata TaxID=408067 RepID=UPI00248CA327|nr:class I SAM-dependent methyltransferase [Yinghuangia seranimata]MDI2127330.1 class I SAM-dependent methyltransferase [Yinghuangia seranimata]